MTIEKIPIESREQWLALRRRDLTGSEMGALFGCDPYKTPAAIWAEKRGLIPPAPDNDVFRRGRWFEPAIWEAVAEREPSWEIRRARIYVRDPQARRGGTPDAVALAPERPGIGVLEGKTVAPEIFERDWVNPSTGEITAPLKHVLQNLHYMELVDASWGAICALILDRYSPELEIVPVDRHAAMESVMRDRAREFWLDFDAGRMPPIEPEHDAAVVKALYPKDTGATIDLTGDNEIAKLVIDRASAKGEIEQWEKQLEAVETAIKAKMKDASYGVLADGQRISWRAQDRAAYTVKATTTRPLKILKPTKERR